MSRIVIAVIGAGVCDDDEAATAFEIGRLIAERDGVILTGGMTGVMEAASRGAREASGLVIGILPGLDRSEANDAVDVALPTGMGQLRNGLVVSAAHAVVAVGGEWGTLSEIGFALKLGKPVIGWRTWEPMKHGEPRNGIVRVDTPAEAVERAFAQVAE